eukprot:m.588773 g.588773  ORF g.588773 m.588773 type:complete len:103 (+) comp22366_c0_seq9:2618-2926(+)
MVCRQYTLHERKLQSQCVVIPAQWLQMLPWFMVNATQDSLSAARAARVLSLVANRCRTTMTTAMVAARNDCSSRLKTGFLFVLYQMTSHWHISPRRVQVSVH